MFDKASAISISGIPRRDARLGTKTAMLDDFRIPGRASTSSATSSISQRYKNILILQLATI